MSDSHEESPVVRPSTSDFDTDATVITPAASVQLEQYPEGLTTRELGHALRGETLGHFLLQELIGGGGMGVVFKAHDTKLDRTVAVKVLASQRLSNEDLQRRFEVEAQSAARLDHPNIARVYESGVERGLPFIVFEFVEGDNLRDAVNTRGPMPVVEALRCAFHAAQALTHAHERNVIHRDIKPSNFLLAPNGEIKLIDMGLARLKPTGEDDELTATGMTLGTFDYISPEQAKDPRDADVRSDIYSLGCTLFFMLTGQAPFSQGTAVQKLMQHQNDTPPDVRSFRPEISRPVAALIRSMLAKAPEDRPQTPAILVALLAEQLQELGVQVTAPLAATPWRPAPQSKTWREHWLPWLAAASAALAGIFVIDRLAAPNEAAPFRNVVIPSSVESSVEPETSPTSTPSTPAATAPADSPTVADRRTADAALLGQEPLSEIDTGLDLERILDRDEAKQEALSVEIPEPDLLTPSTRIDIEPPDQASTPASRDDNAASEPSSTSSGAGP
ncbi:serine/threonine-protein kinase [Pirellulales bacterium]|nr:serine/threonine-protein kinase [Pirellulales bacterium]